MDLLKLSVEHKGIIREIGKQLSMARLPYQYGAELILTRSVEDVIQSDTAFDCSELVEYVFYHAGYKVPDGAKYQYAASEAVGDESLEVGDVVFKEKNGIINHVGIIVNEGEAPVVLEAEGFYGRVLMRMFSEFKNVKNPKASQYAGARRFLLDKVQAVKIV
jgi:hypothetical protein